MPESKRFAGQTAPLAARWCLFNLAPLYKTQQLTAIALREIGEKLTAKKRALRFKSGIQDLLWLGSHMQLYRNYSGWSTLLWAGSEVARNGNPVVARSTPAYFYFSNRSPLTHNRRTALVST